MEPDKILEALKKLSPYPWEAGGAINQNPVQVVSNIMDATGKLLIRPQVGSYGQVILRQADLNFIIAAPKLLEDAAREIARLQASTGKS